VDDKQRVCAQCALFGSHKGHDVRMEEEVSREVQLKVEVLMEMFQAVGAACEELNCTDNYECQYNVFRQRQQEMKEKIQDKFKEWRNTLRAVEMKAIDSLYQGFQQFEDKFSQARAHNSKMVNEGQAWMDRAKQTLDEYTLQIGADPHYIPFEMVDAKKNSAADDILNAGELLIERMEKEKGYPSLNSMDATCSQVKVFFDPNLEKKLQGIARVMCSNNP